MSDNSASFNQIVFCFINLPYSWRVCCLYLIILKLLFEPVETGSQRSIAFSRCPVNKYVELWWTNGTEMRLPIAWLCLSLCWAWGDAACAGACPGWGAARCWGWLGSGHLPAPAGLTLLQRGSSSKVWCCRQPQLLPFWGGFEKTMVLEKLQSVKPLIYLPISSPPNSCVMPELDMILGFFVIRNAGKPDCV